MTESTVTSAPPSSQPIPNIVEVVASKDSRILSVSVYSGRAEVTRLFTLPVKAGQNNVSIRGLPTVVDQDSLRVEGRGSATIHDVTISRIEPPPIPATSPRLSELESELKKVMKALARAKKAASSLDSYINDLHAEHVDVSKLQSIVDQYDTTAEKLDDKITELEGRHKDLEEKIEEEKKVLSGPQANEKLSLKAEIGVFAESEGEIDIGLIYAVKNATWTAAYDIRVGMHAKDHPVTLIYKGSITQSTGEDWNDVPIALETAAPTFGVEIPALDRWSISTYRFVQLKTKAKPLFRSSGGGGHRGGLASDMELRNQIQRGGLDAEIGNTFASSRRNRSRSSSNASIHHRELEVSRKGSLTATFSVPGLMTVPSDGVPHNVTIVKLSLDAEMEWVSVPKAEAKVHLKAIVKNASEYTLLSGPGSVYVDGSFIARTAVPLVSPDETFDCPLGLDPSIRITYPPVTKRATQVGLLTRSSVYTYTQRVTIHNTKSTAIKNVNIIDQIPVSEDSTIVVKIISPPLQHPEIIPDSSRGSVKLATTPSPSGSGFHGVSLNKLGVRVPPPLALGQGVTVQWHGVDEVTAESDLDNLAAEGKLAWRCEIPAQGKVTLMLQWEVSAPLKTTIFGL